MHNESGLWESIRSFFGFEVVEDRNADDQLASLSRPESTKSSAAPFLSSEIKIEEPRVYEDSVQISTQLRDNKPVIVNLKYVDSDTGKRLIDFVCGTAYAINGHMMKIGEHIFLFTPENVTISNPDVQTGIGESLEKESVVNMMQDSTPIL